MAFLSADSVRKLGWDILPWILGILIVVLAIASTKQLIKRYQIQQEISRLENQIVSAKEDNMAFLELLDYVKTSAYTEEQARLRFGLAAPGERLVIIPPQGTVAGAVDSLDNSNSSGQSARGWWRLFFQ